MYQNSAHGIYDQYHIINKMVLIANFMRIRVRLELKGHISALCATSCSVAPHHRRSPYIQNTKFSVTLDTFTHCHTLQHTATHRKTRHCQHTAMNCNTSHTVHVHMYVALDTGTRFHQWHHCNTLQHAATRCNIATHSKTLHPVQDT